MLGDRLYSWNAIWHQSSIALVIDLAEVRRAAGVTQVQLAVALKMSQGQISRIERQRDMLLSTLAAYLTALGVEAQIVVQVGDQTMAYGLTAGSGGLRERRVDSLQPRLGEQDVIAVLHIIEGLDDSLTAVFQRQRNR